MNQNNSIRPEYYRTNNYECLDVLKEILGLEGYKAFCRGNVFKYIWRAPEKGGISDLLKAGFYLDELISSEEEKEG